MDNTTEQVTIGSTNDEKRKYLFLKQIATLKAFRDRNAISKEQYDISHNGLVTKMGITEQELQEWLESQKDNPHELK